MDVIWWVTAVVGAIAVNLIASELFAWGPRLSEWLMRCAVRRLAPEMQDRMREEWAGHLQTIPPGLWRIVAATGFYLAARRINVALRGRWDIRVLLLAAAQLAPLGALQIGRAMRPVEGADPVQAVRGDPARSRCAHADRAD